MSAKAIRHFMKLLRHRDEATQLDAMDGLSRFGPLAFEAVQPLKKLLSTYNTCIRARAANTLGRIGPASSDVLSTLSGMLSDGSLSVRSNVLKAINRIGPIALPDVLNSFLYDDSGAKVQAAHALAALGKDSAVAIPDLTRALKDEDASVRVQAAKTLAAIGEPIDEHIPAIVAILKKHDEMNRPKLAEALASFDKVAKAAVPMLQKLVMKEPKKPKEDPRPAAILALGKLGAVSKPAIPDLMTFITGEDGPLRSAAIIAIGRMGPAASEVVPEFIKLLPKAGEKRTILMVEALGRIGPAADAAIPLLLQLLPAAYGETREKITSALASMGPKAAEAVPYFVKALGDKSPHVRFDALNALSQLGEHAQSAAPALITALSDADASVRLTAMQALGKIPNPPESLVAELKRRLDDRDAKARRAAVKLLAKLKVRDADLEAKLTSSLTSPYNAVRFEAAEYLWYLTGDATASMPILREAMVDSDRAVRQNTLELVRQIAGKDRDALAVLIQALRNPDEPIGRPAANALIAFGDSAIPVLIKSLNDHSTPVRSGALYVLGRLGKKASKALDAILATFDDAEADVRWSAARAVSAMKVDVNVVGPKLAELLKDEADVVRGWAALSLSQLGAEVLPFVTPILKQGTTKAQIAACDVLAKLGPVAIPAVSHVGPLLREENQQLQTWANRAIDAICRDIQAEIQPYLDLLGNTPREYQEWAAHELAARGGKVVPLILKMMGDGDDEDFVWGASETLALIGPEAEPAAPLLIRALDDTGDDFEVPDRIARALAAIGPASVPLLTAALRHTNANVRLGAVDALSRMGAKAMDGVPALVELLSNEPSPGMQRFFSEALGEIGDAGILAIGKAIANADTTAKGRLIHALGVIGQRASITAAELLPALEHTETAVRVEALWALGRIPPDDKVLPKILDGLVESLTDDELRVREQAALTLGRFGARALPALAKVLPALSDTDPAIRLVSTLAVGEIARGSKKHADLAKQSPALLTVLIPIAQSDADTLVRGQALRTLAAVPDTKKVLPLLVAGLKDPSVLVQIRAVDALGALGADGEPTLRECLKHENPIIRRAALQTVIAVKPKDLVSVLAEKLEDADWQVADRSAKELELLKEAAKPAIPALVKALRASYSGVRISALKVLKELDPEGEQTVPGLIEALIDKNADIRTWSSGELAAYKEKAATAIPLLIVLSGEVVPNVQWRAATTTARNAGNALKAIGVESVPLIKAAIQQPHETLRLRAFDALESYHRTAHEMLKPYRKQMGAPTQDVKDKIEEAFADFGATGGATGTLSFYMDKLQNKQSWHPRWEGAIGIGNLAKDKRIPEDKFPEIIDALLKTSEDGDYDVREKSAEALGLIGAPAAEKAGERILTMMGDQTAKVRVAAVIALGRLGEDGVKIDTLVKLLNPKKNSTDLVRVAIELLSKRTGKAGKALDAIIKCLEIKDLNVRVWAVWAIGLLGGKNKDALAAVEPLTIEPHPRIQSWSAASLAHLTEKAEVVMPVVQRVLICREEDTRRGVLAAITKLGKKAMPTLLSCTANVNPRIRQQACVVMGELRDFTDDTKAVLDRLAEKDHDEDVRNAAIEAKKKLSEPLKTPAEPLVPASR